MSKKEFVADIMETVGSLMAMAGMGWFFVEIFFGWLNYYRVNWVHICFAIALLVFGLMFAQWGSEDYWIEQSYLSESKKRTHKAR